VAYSAYFQAPRNDAIVGAVQKLRIDTRLMTNTQAHALEISGVSYRFGTKQALDDVGFTIAPGEFKVLLGPNGAGKTTLFSLVTRLYDTLEGRISVNGATLTENPSRALARMGVVFQQPTLDLDLSVRQNLLYHAALHGLSRGQAMSRMEAELSRLDMRERIDERVRNLNGGHRRRVEIARALMHQPNLLLLDEPTVGLDVPSRRHIVEHVHSLSSHDGIAVLWATHLIDEVHDGDSVIVMDQGRVRADGALSEVIAHSGSSDLAGAFDLLTGRDAA